MKKKLVVTSCIVFIVLVVSVVKSKNANALCPIVGYLTVSCGDLDQCYPGRGGCYKQAFGQGGGCTGEECNHGCCAPGYDCHGVVISQWSLAQSAPCVPIDIRRVTNTCIIEHVGGEDVLIKDCAYGLTCPASGNGACTTCSPNYGGICYKHSNGAILDECCSGYMCPDKDDLTSGANLCIKGDAKVRELLTTINGIMLPVAVILGVFLIVVKGYKIMSSQGDPTALQEGKEGLTSAIIGLIFVLMAVSILRVIIKALISGDTDPFS